MRILPAVTKPAAARIDRRHRPPKAAWPTYRPCLRWEFGFSCAFCLVHEADLSAHGIRGTGLTSIEHFIRKKTDPARANEYENCFYVCRFCNQARGTAPNRDPNGHHLLNPCAEVWAERFAARDDRLKPRAGDADATYTHEIYDLDEPRKTLVRRDRRRTIDGALRIVADSPERLKTLLNLAEHLSPRDAGDLLEAAEDLQDRLREAHRELERWRAEPKDADAKCRCRTSGTRHLPSFLEAQTSVPPSSPTV